MHFLVNSRAHYALYVELPLQKIRRVTSSKALLKSRSTCRWEFSLLFYTVSLNKSPHNERYNGLILRVLSAKFSHNNVYTTCFYRGSDFHP